MRKAILILRREISILTGNKILPLLIVLIIFFLCGLFPEAKRHAEHVINPDLVLEYQKAIFTLAVAISVFLPIGVGRVMSSIIGATLFTREFESSTMSTLGTLPIRRESIFLGKFLAVTLICFIIALFYGLGTWIICLLTLGLPPFNLVVFTIFFIFVGCLYFSALSMLVSSLFRNSIAAIFLSLNLIYLSGFLVYSGLIKNMDLLKWLPEYYLQCLYNHLFKPKYIGSSEPSLFLSITVILLIVVILLAASAIILRFKDI